VNGYEKGSIFDVDGSGAMLIGSAQANKYIPGKKGAF
jgi:hypothetical protein